MVRAPDSIAVMHTGGKPYREQDKVGTCRPSFWLNVRVCRIDKWLPLSLKAQNPAYRLPILIIFKQHFSLLLFYFILEYI